jgi:hypothetical protein
MKHTSTPKPVLSPHRAFVVQLYTDAEITHEHLAGRVEHVVSGQTSDFHSMEELLTFMVQVLTPDRPKPHRSP